MSELMFAVRTLAVSVLIILGLQIKVGDAKLETKLENFVKSSEFIVPLQEVAEGAALGIQRGTESVKRFVTEQFESRSKTQERIERAIKN